MYVRPQVGKEYIKTDVTRDYKQSISNSDVFCSAAIQETVQIFLCWFRFFEENVLIFSKRYVATESYPYRYTYSLTISTSPSSHQNFSFFYILPQLRKFLTSYKNRH